VFSSAAATTTVTVAAIVLWNRSFLELLWFNSTGWWVPQHVLQSNLCGQNSTFYKNSTFYRWWVRSLLSSMSKHWKGYLLLRNRSFFLDFWTLYIVITVDPAVYLTHLDYLDTEGIMTEKLHNQVNGTEWSWKNLNTVTVAYTLK